MYRFLLKMMTKIINMEIIIFLIINMKMIEMSRVDREGEAEVCSERDTHHPVAALAWFVPIIIIMVMMVWMNCGIDD